MEVLDNTTNNATESATDNATHNAPGLPALDIAGWDLDTFETYLMAMNAAAIVTNAGSLVGLPRIAPITKGNDVLDRAVKKTCSGQKPNWNDCNRNPTTKY